MKKRDTNVYKNSKIENIFICITGLLFSGIGLLFIIGGLLFTLVRIIPLLTYVIMLCLSFIAVIGGYLFLFNYPFIIELKDDFLEYCCFFKKGQIKWENVTIKRITPADSPMRGPTFIIKIKNKNILSKYLFIVYDIRDIIFNSGKENLEMEEEIRKRIVNDSQGKGKGVEEGYILTGC